MRIGVSQRVEVIASYGERRDCLDQQWNNLLISCGITPVPIPNGIKDLDYWFKKLNIVGFILTGGNDLSFLPDASNPAPERDKTEKQILRYAKKNRLPVLGVCRGFQMMNVFLNGQISPVNNHVATRHQLISVSNEEIFGRYNNVNSFHNWGSKKSDISNQVIINLLAKEDETVEAVTHKILPWIGVMWHPERENPFKSEDVNLIKHLFHD